MRDRDRRRLEAGAHLLDHLHDDVRRDRVEAGRRLVEEQVLGLEGDRPREPHAPLHAPRELGRPLFLDAGQTHELEALGHPLCDLLFRLLRVSRERKRDVLADAHRVEERAFLERHPELAAQSVALAGRCGPQVLPVDLDRAGVRLQEADDVFQKDALADSRLSDEHERFALLDLEIEADENFLRAEAFETP